MSFETEPTLIPISLEPGFITTPFDSQTTQAITPPTTHTEFLQLTDVIAPTDEIAIPESSSVQSISLFDIETVQNDFDAFKNSNQSFLIIDLGFSKELLDSLHNMTITQQQEYNNFGNLDSLNSDVQHFLTEISTANEQEINTVSQTIEQLTKNILTILGKETAWIALRGFTENHAFDIPRWHIDGYFNEAPTGSNFEVKFGTALIGPQTLFYPLPSEARETFFDHEANRNELHLRYPVSNAMAAEAGQGAFFVVGNQQRAAIHSEPKMENGRLFFSIVAGTQEEIRALDKRLNRITIQDHVNSHTHMKVINQNDS